MISVITDNNCSVHFNVINLGYVDDWGFCYKEVSVQGLHCNTELDYHWFLDNFDSSRVNNSSDSVMVLSSTGQHS